MEENEKKEIAFETLSSEDALTLLQTDKEVGLTSEEAKKRLEQYGPNKLQEKKKKSLLMIFLSQLADPMIYVLFAATLVSIIVSIVDMIEGGPGDWADVIIILAVVLINAIIGTVEEKKAETSLEALKKMSAPESTVIRDGKRFKIKSEELVPGDIVILEEGDTIGADLRLIEAINLKCNESSLTGESVPVDKKSDMVFSQSVAVGDRVNVAYMSTPVSYGRGRGVVTRTGMNTEIGKIANALDNEEETMTPLQKKLAQLSKTLGFITLAIIIFTLIVAIIWLLVKWQNGTADITEPKSWLDIVLQSIALAVAAIPEGLPAVVSIVLAIGVRKMVKVNTIVRKLPSVETLGAVKVVCSDKTGTLTQNKMTVVEAYLPGEYFKEDNFSENGTKLEVLSSGMSLCSNATVDEGLYGDPTEIALVAFANVFDHHKKDLETKEPRIDELPFDSVRKMMSTLHKREDGTIIQYTKGALDSVLSFTKYIKVGDEVREITEQDIEEINKANSYFSSKALRSLALSYKLTDTIGENDLVFVGLVAMIDPPRPECKNAVYNFKGAGITTVMITGDHKDTAFAIAKDLGIVDDINQCRTGKEIDDLTEEELQDLVKTVRVFARVSPENKVSIVKAFKANGNICAMTGDGVNDAPSLKAADIGIAMGITGTDVAKGAADMVLTDDNFASIEKAVEEGRGIYSNIKKTVLFLLSCNMGEVFSTFFMICCGFPAPLIAIHLLWVNLITDSLPAISLGMDPKDPLNMKDKPRNPEESIFAHGGWPTMIGYGIVIAVITVLGFMLTILHLNDWNVTYDYISHLSSDDVVLQQAQTVAFTVLAVSQLFHMLGMSNPRRSFIHVFKNKNWMMLVAFLFGLGLQVLVVEVPMMGEWFSTIPFDGFEWVITFSLAIVPLIVHEISVFIMWLRRKHNEKKVSE